MMVVEGVAVFPIVVADEAAANCFVGLGPGETARIDEAQGKLGTSERPGQSAPVQIHRNRATGSHAFIRPGVAL
jgi:hypothetical protein